MVSTIFALDIHDDLVTGVMVNCVAKTHIVTACGIAEVGSGSLETAISEVIEQVGYKEGTCWVSLGAEHFFYRNLLFPFADKNKISRVIPGELAEASSLEAERIVFDFLLANKKGKNSSVITAIAERAFLAEQLELLQRLAVDPETLGISGTYGAARLGGLADIPEDYIFLDVGFRKAVLVLIFAGQIALVRPLVFDVGLQAGFRLTEDRLDVFPLRPENLALVYSAFARAVWQTLLAARGGLQSQDIPLYLAGPVGSYPGLAEALHSETGIEVKQCDMRSMPFLKIEDEIASCWHAGSMDRPLSLALGAEKNGRVFNFRKDGLRKKESIKKYRRYCKVALLPMALLFFLVIAYCWHDQAMLRKQKVALDGQIRDVFSQTIPDVTRIVNPVQQLQVRIKEAKQAYMAGGPESTNRGMLTLLAEVSERIPASLQVKIIKMVADQNDVRIKGTTENFNIVDNVQKELGKSPFFSKVEISSANLSSKGGAVDFELKLDLRR
ncbi:MAG: PilN domain-containing protein [Desulfoprunum sp.]|nr:PilN domain-containing protein [Desulfoprunum sp.]